MRNKIFLAALLAVSTLCPIAQAQVPLPPGVQATLTPVLKYRDPAVPLSIGEMSEMQAKKSEEDFLGKFGYTTILAAPVPTGANAGSQMHKSKPMMTLMAISIYGPSGSPSADIAINGVVSSVKGGEQFRGGVGIDSVTQHTVNLTVSSKNKGGTAKKYAIAVGDVFEMPLK